MENINNEQVETKKKDRRWVVRAIIAFLVILALLTFFSNTIMNATIPKVMAKNAVRGNLSYTNNATGQIEADNKSEAKGIEGRTVDKVLVQNYEYVEEGATVITLKQAKRTKISRRQKRRSRNSRRRRNTSPGHLLIRPTTHHMKSR